LKLLGKAELFRTPSGEADKKGHSYDDAAAKVFSAILFLVGTN
jgi:hypothetical protein